MKYLLIFILQNVPLYNAFYFPKVSKFKTLRPLSLILKLYNDQCIWAEMPLLSKLLLPASIAPGISEPYNILPNKSATLKKS